MLSPACSGTSGTRPSEMSSTEKDTVLRVPSGAVRVTSTLSWLAVMVNPPAVATSRRSVSPCVKGTSPGLAIAPPTVTRLEANSFTFTMTVGSRRICFSTNLSLISAASAWGSSPAALCLPMYGMSTKPSGVMMYSRGSLSSPKTTSSKRSPGPSVEELTGAGSVPRRRGLGAHATASTAARTNRSFRSTVYFVAP